METYQYILTALLAIVGYFLRDVYSRYKQLEKEHSERKKQAFRGLSFESGLSKQIMENFNTLQQIGYLEPRVLESDGVINFVSQYDSNGVGIQKRSRGRPKRVEVYYEDLV